MKGLCIFFGAVVLLCLEASGGAEVVGAVTEEFAEGPTPARDENVGRPVQLGYVICRRGTGLLPANGLSCQGIQLEQWEHYV